VGFHFEEQEADNTGKDACEYDQKLWTFGTSLRAGKGICFETSYTQGLQ